MEKLDPAAVGTCPSFESVAGSEQSRWYLLEERGISENDSYMYFWSVLFTFLCVEWLFLSSECEDHKPARTRGIRIGIEPWTHLSCILWIYCGVINIVITMNIYGRDLSRGIASGISLTTILMMVCITLVSGLRTTYVAFVLVVTFGVEMIWLQSVGQMGVYPIWVSTTTLVLLISLAGIWEKSGREAALQRLHLYKLHASSMREVNAFSTHNLLAWMEQTDSGDVELSIAEKELQRQASWKKNPLATGVQLLTAGCAHSRV